MQHTSSGLSLSASDLANHLGCRRLTALDLLAAHGELEPPSWRDPNLDVLAERGLRHERAYVDSLRARGLDVVDLREGDRDPARTAAAMASGVDVVVQAPLADGCWRGLADVLLRVDEPSDLGDWSYDVVDTKLAQETRGGTVLQLCLYADLLKPLQGRPATRLMVVKPGADFPTDVYRFDEHAAYFRAVRARLERTVDTDGEALLQRHGPDPVPQCDICRWWPHCDSARRDADHLCLVAGMSTLHADELRRQTIPSLEAFVANGPELPEPPKRGHSAGYANLHAQAAIQLRGRQTRQPEVELLPAAPERGLALLPEPDPGDVYLDFEGDPFVDGGGLEYLLGYVQRDDSGAETYHAAWALGRADEKRAFEAFMDDVGARMQRFPGLHVYHYAPYEPAALKRLASRHATREAVLDEWLRAGRFVDLYAVVRQGLRASVESYSLKPLESFYGFERQVDLRKQATPALRRVQAALELGDADEILPADREAVEGYNREDCASLVALQAWLEIQRDAALADGASIERPLLRDGRAGEEAEERDRELAELFDALMAGVPDDDTPRDANQHGRWLLAHLLEYFRREERVTWWEYFARRDADDETRFKDRKCITGLEFVEELPPLPGRRLQVHAYRFPPQDVSLDEDAGVRDLDALEGDADKLGSVVACDPARGRVEIQKMKASLGTHPRALHEFKLIKAGDVGRSLHAVARDVAQQGLDAAATEHTVAQRLLLRAPPGDGTDVCRDDERPTDAAQRLVRELDGDCLAIQGPPGAGKTWLGARMIVDLAQAGRCVGVTATSHKVIRNLLAEVVDVARQRGLDLPVLHKTSSPKPEPVVGIRDMTDAAKVVDALGPGVVAGGVAWTWARDDVAGKLDHLFVDEAGQMALAPVLACTRATRNLVLLGDPLQLQQPQRGAHPDGAEVSALDHWLGGAQTMPPEQGLFLAETWRLPPSLCAYTSEVFYESKLRPAAGNARLRLHGDGPLGTGGLFHLPVEHAGNQSVSHEEVAAVVGLVDAILAGHPAWTDNEGVEQPLTRDDILVVAPFNAQVAELARALPGVAVGTVDRFQGQQRPVVLYSMASSSAQDSPRGMSFLYDLHRLNVATSRARCACVIVSTPALLQPECRSPEQIRLANGLCRFVELATSLDPSTLV